MEPNGGFNTPILRQLAWLVFSTITVVVACIFYSWTVTLVVVVVVGIVLNLDTGIKSFRRFND
jgi:hypothetical protein